MTSRSDVLRGVMLETSTTQSDLSRLSGVRQPSISGFLSGKFDLSDDQLDRLLSRLGFCQHDPRVISTNRLASCTRKKHSAAHGLLLSSPCIGGHTESVNI